MGTISIIIIIATAAAIAVGGGVVFLADRYARREHFEDEPVVSERPAPSTCRKVDNASGVPTAMQITPSPGRQCLLAYKRLPLDTDGDAGTCACMRGTICLWSTQLINPFFMAVNDEGCAAFFDREDNGGNVRVKIVDVAGIERFNESFQDGMLEWGATKDGNYVWGMTEPGPGIATQSEEFLLWALDFGIPVIRCTDPRALDKNVKGVVISVDVNGEHASIGFDEGRGVTLPFTGKNRIHRPSIAGKVLEIVS